MGTRNVLVTVFLVLVVGGGLAWFFARGDGGDTARGGGAVTANRPEAADSAHAKADMHGTEAIKSGAGAAAAGREEARVDPGLVSGLAGPGTTAEPTPALSGRVLDTFGRPIPGATVLAGNESGFPLDFVADGPVPPFVRRVVATTDSDGRYELEGIAPPSMRMRVRAPGYVPHDEDSILLPDVETYELADVVLELGGVLEGLVVDPFGRGVADAELFLERTSGFRIRGFFGSSLSERPAAVTDANGRFRIDEMQLGAWRVRVESEEHPERTFEGITERPEQPVTRTFELELGDVVAGRVVDVPSAEKGGLVVQATPAQEPGFFGFGGAGTRQGKVDTSGAFVVKGLRPESEYNLQVRLRDTGMRFGGFGARTRSERISARSGQKGVEIPYKPEAAVLFQVVDALTGDPVEEYRVESGFRWREPLLDDDAHVIDLHPEGRTRIGNLRPDESPASLEIGITAVGYKPWEREDVQVVSAQETDLGVIRLDPQPMVNVTVVDASTGAPIPGAQVSLEEQQDEPQGFSRGGFRSLRNVSIQIDDSTGEPVAIGDPGRTAVTDEDGLARLNSLEGKTATVRVRRDGYAPTTVSGLALPEGRPFDQTVELGRGGVVVARVVDETGAPAAGVRVEHREPGGNDLMLAPFLPGGRPETTTGASGEVRFENLAAGEHSFRIGRTGGRGGFRGGNMAVAFGGGAEEPGWEMVVVAEGSEDTVTLMRATQGTLSGRITEIGADLVGASVRVSQAGRRGGFDFGGAFGGGDAERTDSSGRYRLEDLEPGEYTLTISHPKRRMPAEFPVTIKSGENRMDVELPVSILQGRITDEAGKPLSGVEVTARKADSGGGRPRGRAMFVTVGGPGGGGAGEITLGDELGDSVHTDADGAYELRGVAPDVPLVVRASGDGLQPGESREVSVGENEIVKGVDLKLEAAGAVLVEALQADGSPADFLMVRASYLDEVPKDTTSDGADPKDTFLQGGSARLTGMRPGRWTVSVDPVGPSGGGEGPEPQEVKVEFGVEPKLTFHLP